MTAPQERLYLGKIGRQGQPATPEELAEARRLWDTGATYQEIADALGRPRGTVQGWSHRRGWPRERRVTCVECGRWFLMTNGVRCCSLKCRSLSTSRARYRMRARGAPVVAQRCQSCAVPFRAALDGGACPRCGWMARPAPETVAAMLTPYREEAA